MVGDELRNGLPGATKQSLERWIDGLGLAEPQTDVQGGLDRGLCPRQPAPVQVPEIARNRCWHIVDGTTELAS